MKKTISILIALIVVLGAAFYLWKNEASAPQPPITTQADYKNTSYAIDGKTVTLVDGVAETDAAPGSASKVTTRYLGNELKTDLNGDGREDVVFILTQAGGGSGTFYYVVAALNTENGFVGSDGYLLGDRITPQTITVSDNPNQKGVVVVRYADRKAGEPMTTAPSVDKRVDLKLDPATMQWGVVAQDFEGESANGIRGVAMLGPTCPVMKDPPDPACADKPYQASLVVTTSDQSSVIKTFSTGADGTFRVELPPGTYAIRSAAGANILPRCASQGTISVASGSFTEATIYCDTGIR